MTILLCHRGDHRALAFAHMLPRSPRKSERELLRQWAGRPHDRARPICWQVLALCRDSQSSVADESGDGWRSWRYSVRPVALRLRRLALGHQRQVLGADGDRETE